MAKRAARYWDAGPFIAWLTNETRDDRAQKCEPVIRAGERGGLLIVTSSVSLIEVVKLDKKDAPINIGAEAAAKISGFFRQSYITVRELDTRTGELARDLIWQFNLSTRDAIHLATAMRYGIRQVDSFDGGLLALDGKLGQPTIRISEPDLPQQLNLELGEGEALGQETDEEAEADDAEGR